MLKSFGLALMFLTRIPVPSLGELSEQDQGRSILFYPLVGLLIGVFSIALLWAGPANSPMVTAALILTGWVLVTGGLHLDGLADSADGWLGGHGDTERTLEIMKDSRSGAAAIVIVILLLIVKFAALTVIVSGSSWQALLLAPFVGRYAILLLFATTPYAREGGMGERVHNFLGRIQVGTWTLTAILCSLMLAGFSALWVLVAAVAIFLAMRQMMMKTLGGTTGDTAGALVEVTEATVLLGFTYLI